MTKPGSTATPPGTAAANPPKRWIQAKEPTGVNRGANVARMTADLRFLELSGA